MAKNRNLYTGPRVQRWKFPIATVLEAMAPGAPLPGNHSTGKAKTRCPFHDDRTASASIDYSNQRFACYSAECGVNGDAVDVVQAVEGVTRAQARDRCQSIVDPGGRQLPGQPRPSDASLFDF